MATQQASRKCRGGTRAERKSHARGSVEMPTSSVGTEALGIECAFEIEVTE